MSGERDWTAELTVNRETKNVIIAILLHFFLRLLVSGRVVGPFKRVENGLHLSEILTFVIFRGIDETVKDNDVLTVTAIEGM